jgi:integrase
MTLQKRHVNLESRTLTFEETKTVPRTIPLPDYLVGYMAKRVSDVKSDTDWLFANSDNLTGHVTEYKSTILSIVKHSQGAISPFSAHDLRRTFITYGSAVCPGDYVQLIVGHKLTSVTGRHYFKPDVEEIRPHMNAIAKRILSIATQKK